MSRLNPAWFALLVVGLMGGAGIILGSLTGIALHLLGVRGASERSGEV